VVYRVENQNAMQVRPCAGRLYLFDQVTIQTRVTKRRWMRKLQINGAALISNGNVPFTRSATRSAQALNRIDDEPDALDHQQPDFISEEMLSCIHDGFVC
jgi:hypothetical protein